MALADFTSPSVSEPVRALMQRGVVVHCPASVDVDPSVKADRIAPGAVIHAGCRVLGAETSIGPGCIIGAEAPATVENCQLGKEVELKGGFFSGAVFLDGSSMASGAHVRPGTILEEEANAAHTVGFKQTILMPFITAGSLINFCDCLMAGGTSRQNHSEIGSSYVHFNFTPHGDKATPSLLGDAPRGVMLDQPPIFLGGQGGIVGPVRIEYGCVAPAGVVCRRDMLEKGALAGSGASWKSRPYRTQVYRNVGRIITNNLVYIGNLRALQAWYMFARRRTMDSDSFSRACWEGALKALEAGVAERVRRLAELAGKMVHSAEFLRAQAGGASPAVEIAEQQAFIDGWSGMDSALRRGPHDSAGGAGRDSFLGEWERVAAGKSHVGAVGALSAKAREAGTAWLQARVDSVAALWKSG